MPFKKHICRDIFTDKTNKKVINKSKWPQMTFSVTATYTL